jgi:two-component sensor histidine kinase
VATEVSAYVDGLNGRVQALARAHDQVTCQNWGPGSITSLFDDEIAAHCPEGPGRLVIEGPSVLMQRQAITTLALSFMASE